MAGLNKSLTDLDRACLLPIIILLATLACRVCLPHPSPAAPGTWSYTGDMGAPRTGHTATLLPNGKVLVTAGHNDSGGLTTVEIYDPASGAWSPTGSLDIIRNDCTVTLLPNGKVLVAGGQGKEGDPPVTVIRASAELYEPHPPPKVPLPPLLAFYPFEGNAQDASGNGRHGAMTGFPMVVEGWEGLAYSFGGGFDTKLQSIDN